MLEFTNGITWEMRQRHREVILAATRKDLIEVAEKYLTPSVTLNLCAMHPVNLFFHLSGGFITFHYDFW